MGMESFFINIEIHNQVVSYECLEKRLTQSFSLKNYSSPSGRLLVRRIIHEQMKVVNNSIIFSSEIIDNSTHICLEACLANYSNNVQVMYKIVTVISKEYLNICLFYGKKKI